MDRYQIGTGKVRRARTEKIQTPGKADEPREFKSGFVMLAIMSGARIVPYAINGRYNMFFGRRQRVLIGEPTELTAEGKGLTPKYLESESERFRQIVIELMNKTKGEER